MGQCVRLAFVVSHPIQYFVPVFRKLASQPGVGLLVIYHHRAGLDAYHDPGFGRSIQWDIPMLEGYAYRFLSGGRRAVLMDLGVVRCIREFRPHALIVHGYNGGTNLLATIAAKISGIPCFMRGDTRLSGTGRLGWGKRTLKRQLFKMYDGFLSIGTLNAEYYEAHGVSRDRIFFAPFCVANDAFVLPAKEAMSARESIRSSLGIPDSAKVILFASKLLPRKRAADLIGAYEQTAEALQDAHLILAGSGEEESELKHMCAQRNLKSRVHFLGFQNQSRLPMLFAAADVFVLPAAAEPWGLVVNEAMAAGLPVIVSDEVGAAADLVTGKGSGVVFKCGDSHDLAAALRAVLDNESARRAMAEKARKLIEGWSVDHCADRILDAVSEVLKRRSGATS